MMATSRGPKREEYDMDRAWGSLSSDPHVPLLCCQAQSQLLAGCSSITPATRSHGTILFLMVVLKEGYGWGERGHGWDGCWGMVRMEEDTGYFMESQPVLKEP